MTYSDDPAGFRRVSTFDDCDSVCPSVICFNSIYTLASSIQACCGKKKMGTASNLNVITSSKSKRPSKRNPVAL